MNDAHTPLAVSHGPAAGAAVARWNELLSAPGGEGQANRLVELQLERNATVDGRPLSRVAQPRFIDVREETAWSAVTDLMASASRKVIAALRADLDAYVGELGDFEALERELIFAPYGYDWPDISARWDGFATGEHMTFVELNGAVPGGIHFEDALAGCYEALPVFEQVSREVSIRRTDMTAALWEAMVAAWRAWGGTGQPVVGITDWLGGHEHTEPEFWLFREWLEARGITAIVVDPREWELVDGRLTAQGASVDLLYRRLTTPDTLARPDDCRVLIEAFKANAACVVDPFEMGLLHRKAFFSLLTDPALRFGFTTQEQAAIEATVPWTRRLRDRVTVLPDGTEGDLVAHVAANPGELVLKPGDDGAGRGVHLGWTMSESEWSAAVDEALAADYVVQQRVRQVVDRFPSIDPWGEWTEYYMDTDPLIAGGRSGGFVSRLSTAELTNVALGGSVVPTFVAA